MKPENNIKYIVKVKDEFIPLFNKTTIAKGVFCGEIIKKGNQMIFELNGPSHANIIIPCDWIEWLAPSCINFAQFKDFSTELKEEEYPYNLYYLGEKVGKVNGKVKWPLLFSDCRIEKIFEVK